MKKSILLGLLMVILIPACTTPHRVAPIRSQGVDPRDWLREILPTDQAEPVSYERSVFPESLSQQDIDTLVTLLGRIPRIDKTIVAVRSPWDYPVCVVAVIVRDYVVYFVKTIHGWDYSDANYMTDWNVGKPGEPRSGLYKQ